MTKRCFKIVAAVLNQWVKEEVLRALLFVEFAPYGPAHWEDDWTHCWASTPANVTVKWIGTAVEGTKAGVVLASYNAG